jgi:hypothetical protein
VLVEFAAWLGGMVIGSGVLLLIRLAVQCG